MDRESVPIEGNVAGPKALRNGEIWEVNSLFQQPWWLDAVAPGAWGVVEVRSGGLLQARLPFVLGGRYGLRWIRQPLLTQTLGPWVRDSEAKYCTALGRQKDLLFALIEQLPRHDLFSQNFHYTFANWLPFFWRGFTANSRITYVIDDLSSEEALWRALQENARREVRKASKLVHVHDTQDLGQFLDLNAMTFSRQGKVLPYSRDDVARLDQACAERGCRKILLARDAHGRLHAGIYLVWDERCAYYLMGGGNAELRSSGATSLLMWEGIRFAATVTRAFDFEGSMGENLERFVRSFGGRQKAYLNVRRMSRRMRLLSAARDLVRATLGSV